MPTESTYSPIEIPPIDIWSLLFERKDRPFPDDKGVTLLRKKLLLPLNDS